MHRPRRFRTSGPIRAASSRAFCFDSVLSGGQLGINQSAQVQERWKQATATLGRPPFDVRSSLPEERSLN